MCCFHVRVALSCLLLTIASAGLAQNNLDPVLTLWEGRFIVAVSDLVAQTEREINIQGELIDDVTGTNEMGYISFFDAEEADIFIRVFDGCTINDHFWVFIAPITKVQYELTVTDTLTSTSKIYTSPNTTPFKPIQDTNAFATCPSHPTKGQRMASLSDGVYQTGVGGLPANSKRDDHWVDLLNGRFRVSSNWRIPGQGSGEGIPGVKMERTGSFAFLDRSDQNVFFKIVDRRSTNGHFWFYYTSLTGAEYDLIVEDTQTGLIKTFHNPLEESTYGTDIILDQPVRAVVFPWVSYNNDFDSFLTIYNSNCLPANLLLEAVRGNGDHAISMRSIPPNGFLNESAADLFPDLGSGPGFAVAIQPDVSGLRGSWVTTNRATNSPASGSGVLNPPLGQEANDPDAMSFQGSALLFSPLVVGDDLISAPVVVNMGDEATEVTLYLYDSNGVLLNKSEEPVYQLGPMAPLALLTQDVAPVGNATYAVVAYSMDQPLAGTVFNFNQDGEPSITDAVPVAFVPPN